jgi:hypothetical protein
MELISTLVILLLQALFFGTNNTPSSGAFTPSYVTSGSCNSGGATCTITLAVSAGNFAVCGVGSSSVPTNTLTCSSTSVTSFAYPTSNPYLYTATAIGGLGWGTINVTSGASIFTCTVTNSTNYMGCVVSIYSGTPTSGWDVAVAGAVNLATTSFTSGTSAATANASELAVGLFVQAIGSCANYTGTNGYTVRNASATENCVALEDKVLTVTGTQTATATLSTLETGLGVVSTIK